MNSIEDDNTLRLRQVVDGATHHLWEPPAHKSGSASTHPYRLRLSVLSDDEEHGDCPSQTFVRSSPLFHASLFNLQQMFPSLHHLTHATNILNFQFPQSEYATTKCGVETPSNEGERIEDGHTEMMVIKYDSQRVGGTWKEFLGRLRDAQVGWEVEKPL